MVTSEPLKSFNRVNKSVLLRDPPASSHGTVTPTTASHGNPPPDLILILSWGAAPLKAVAKYTTQYENLYPASRMMLITTTFRDLITHTETSQQKVLASAVDILSSQPNARILVHLFSNGGAYKLVELAKEYRRVNNAILPINALAMDSAPGNSRLFDSIRAMSSVLPKSRPLRPLYWAGITLIFLYLMWLRVYYRILGGMPVTWRVYGWLNDPALIDASSKRLYIFSRSDGMVRWQDVVEHCKIARENAFVASFEEFRGSLHVAHMVKDPQRYWHLIKHLWDGTS